MECRNKNCEWYTEFSLTGCLGTPALISDIIYCVDFKEYEAKLKEEMEKKTQKPEKIEETEETEEIKNPISMLEIE